MTRLKKGEPRLAITPALVRGQYLAEICELEAIGKDEQIAQKAPIPESSGPRRDH